MDEMTNPIVLGRAASRVRPPLEPITIFECSLSSHSVRLLKRSLQIIHLLNPQEVIPLFIKSSLQHCLGIQAQPGLTSDVYIVASLNTPSNSLIQYSFAPNYPQFAVGLVALLQALISTDDNSNVSIHTYFQDLQDFLEYVKGYMHIKSPCFNLEAGPSVAYINMPENDVGYFDYVLDTTYQNLVEIPSAKLVDILRRYDNGEGNELHVEISHFHVMLSLGEFDETLATFDNECIIGGQFDSWKELIIPLDDVKASWQMALRFTKIVWIFISEHDNALYCFPIWPLGNLHYCFEDEEEEEEEEEEEDDDEEEEDREDKD